MHWKCTPGTGTAFVDGSIRLVFGTPRSEIRADFGFDPKTNAGRSDREDQYGKSLENYAHGVRITFSPEDALKEIEILSSVVDGEGVAFETLNGDIKPVLQSLQAKGYAFTRTGHGYTDFNRLISISESGSNGAEHPDRASSVHLSTSFEHLKT